METRVRRCALVIAIAMLGGSDSSSVEAPGPPRRRSRSETLPRRCNCQIRRGPRLGRRDAGRRDRGASDRSGQGPLIVYTSVMPWFFSGTVRRRFPVAAKNALRTAGAATQIVGSPTPPQKPPDGMMIVSTFGIWAIRIES